MTEYIEREAALAKIEWLAELTGDSGREHGLRATIEVLQSIPAAEVAPVRHGRWERVFEDCDLCHRCSLCKKSGLRDGNEYEVLSDYCPNCGAKMDGGGEG